MADILDEFAVEPEGQGGGDVLSEFEVAPEQQDVIRGGVGEQYKDLYPGEYEGSREQWSQFSKTGGRPESAGLSQPRAEAPGNLRVGLPGLGLPIAVGKRLMTGNFKPPGSFGEALGEVYRESPGVDLPVKVPAAVPETAIRVGGQIAGSIPDRLTMGIGGSGVGGAGAEALIRGVDQATGQDQVEDLGSALSRGMEEGTVNQMLGLGIAKTGLGAERLATRVARPQIAKAAGYSAEAGAAAGGILAQKGDTKLDKTEAAMSLLPPLAARGALALRGRKGGAPPEGGIPPQSPRPPKSPIPDPVEEFVRQRKAETGKFPQQVEELTKNVGPPKPHMRGGAPVEQTSRELGSPEDRAAFERALEGYSQGKASREPMGPRPEVDEARARYEGDVKRFQELEPPRSVGEEYRAMRGEEIPNAGRMDERGKWRPAIRGGVDEGSPASINKPVEEVELRSIKLDPERFQFKKPASKAGVVQGEELGGRYERLGTGPILLWESKAGERFVVNGHHRYDLATKAGEKSIPAQIIREAEGVTDQQARALGAEINIRDGTGSTEDYVRFFGERKLSPEDAKAKGLTARAKGRRGYEIAQGLSDDARSAYLYGTLSEDAAAALARAAPGDSARQAAAMRYVQKYPKATGEEVGAFAAALTESGPKYVQGEDDIFGGGGFNDAAIKEAEAMAQAASGMRQDLKRRLAAKGAVRNAEEAREVGVDVPDVGAAQGKLAALKEEYESLDPRKFSTNPETIARLREAAKLAPRDPAAPKERQGEMPLAPKPTTETDWNADVKARAEKLVHGAPEGAKPIESLERRRSERAAGRTPEEEAAERARRSRGEALRNVERGSAETGAPAAAGATGGRGMAPPGGGKPPVAGGGGGGGKPPKKPPTGEYPEQPGEEDFTPGHKGGLRGTRHMQKESAKQPTSPEGPVTERVDVSPQQLRSEIRAFKGKVFRYKTLKNAKEGQEAGELREFVRVTTEPPSDWEFKKPAGWRDPVKQKHNLETVWEVDEKNRYLRNEEGEYRDPRSIHLDESLELRTPSGEIQRFTRPEKLVEAERAIDEAERAPQSDADKRRQDELIRALEGEKSGVVRAGTQKGPGGLEERQGPPWEFNERGRLAGKFGRQPTGVSQERIPFPERKPTIPEEELRAHGAQKEPRGESAPLRAGETVQPGKKPTARIPGREYGGKISQAPERGRTARRDPLAILGEGRPVRDPQVPQQAKRAPGEVRERSDTVEESALAQKLRAGLRVGGRALRVPEKVADFVARKVWGEAPTGGAEELKLGRRAAAAAEDTPEASRWAKRGIVIMGGRKLGLGKAALGTLGVSIGTRGMDWLGKKLIQLSRSPGLGKRVDKLARPAVEIYRERGLLQGAAALYVLSLQIPELARELDQEPAEAAK